MNLQRLKELAALAGVAQSLSAPGEAQDAHDEVAQQHRVAAAIQLMGLQQSQQSDAAMGQFRDASLAQDQAKLAYEKEHDTSQLNYLTQESQQRGEQQKRSDALELLRLSQDPTSDANLRTSAVEALRHTPGFEGLDTAIGSREKAAHHARVAEAVSKLGAVTDPQQFKTAAAAYPDVLQEATNILHPNGGEGPVIPVSTAPLSGRDQRIQQKLNQPQLVPITPTPTPTPTLSDSLSIPFYKLLNQ